MNCPFSEIITQKQERILRKSRYTFTVLSSPRLMPGHLLIIPKRHVQKFTELNEKEREDLFDEAIRLEEIILTKFASGCDLSQHYRPFVKQSRLKIDHLHIHLRPREFKDDLYKKVQKHETAMFTDLKPAEFNKFRKILAKIDK